MACGSLSTPTSPALDRLRGLQTPPEPGLLEEPLRWRLCWRSLRAKRLDPRSECSNWIDGCSSQTNFGLPALLSTLAELAKLLGLFEGGALMASLLQPADRPAPICRQTSPSAPLNSPCSCLPFRNQRASSHCLVGRLVGRPPPSPTSAAATPAIAASLRHCLATCMG